jgi:hypothetical protein
MEKKLYLVTKFVVDVDGETPVDMTIDDIIYCYKDASTTVHENIDSAYERLLDFPGHRLYTILVNSGK